ncbi:MAG: DNA-directed RNA polymerase subunit omega [Thermodesulfobacteriota bacterium]|jgi:DNA-directed RNA polymerase subunit omega|nr:MAG: DNA-directed RNA polymerase subunit omega [Thermodesulfobacteriota bacterium]
MARVTIEDCLKQEGNRYVLIHGAIKRTIQLKKGSTPLINSPGEKLTVIALREIAQGKVKINSHITNGIPGGNSTLT